MQSLGVGSYVHGLSRFYSRWSEVFVSRAMPLVNIYQRKQLLLTNIYNILTKNLMLLHLDIVLLLVHSINISSSYK